VCDVTITSHTWNWCFSGPKAVSGQWHSPVSKEGVDVYNMVLLPVLLLCCANGVYDAADVCTWSGL
jgi:hypothetical protein